jgi:glycosyltransferase involved in cell wall biosynthesis
MKIGIAGPSDLAMLSDLFSPESRGLLPNGYVLTANQARAYFNKGHEVTLFVLSRDVTSTRRLDGKGVTAFVCPQRRPRSQMLDFFRGERDALRDAMRASDCSVIHAHWTYEYGAAAVESGLPHVISAHDIPAVVMKFAQNLYWLEKPLLGWPVLRKAKCVTAVSPYTAEALRTYLKPERDVIVIPNGVTHATFELFERRQPRPEGLPFRFAAVLNGWSGRKNGKRLIEAFGTLHAEFGDKVQLFLFGEGHEGDGEAYQWSRRRGLINGVAFVGSLPYEELMCRLSGSVDVLVHPSFEETFCMAAAEAMAMGIPVIGGRESGGIAWVLGDGEAGLLVDVRSSEAIADGMRTLFQDADLRNALARSGRSRAMREYRLEDVERQYESVLQRALREQTN